VTGSSAHELLDFILRNFPLQYQFLEQGHISPTQYADKANTIIVSALQVTADGFLGQATFRSQQAQQQHVTQRSQQDNGNYSSTHTRIAAKQTSTQTLKNKLRKRQPLRT